MLVTMRPHARVPAKALIEFITATWNQRVMAIKDPAQTTIVEHNLVMLMIDADDNRLTFGILALKDQDPTPLLHIVHVFLVANLVLWEPRYLLTP